MGIGDRKGRDRAERESRIVAAAREIAEREGWDAVTVRRLADQIEYSQPVLYSHFQNRTAIVAAVARDGFRDIALALRNAASGANAHRSALETVAIAYLDFARRRPALYEAMFILPTELRFAQADTPAELKAAFDALAAVVAPFSADVGVVTETFWAALHGLADLERSGRIRASARAQRVTFLVDAIIGSGHGRPGNASQAV